MTLHPERKHRAAGDLERHALHDLAQIGGATATTPQVRDRLIGHRNHVRDQGRHRARRESRRQRAPLMFPGPALGDQKALAEHRTQHAQTGGRAGIVLIIVDQHVTDRIRRVEDEAPAQEKESAADDVILIGALASRCSAVMFSGARGG